VAVINRLAGYRPLPRAHELWRLQLYTMGIDGDLKALLDPAQIDAVLDAMPNPAGGPSPPRVHPHDVLVQRRGGRSTKTNVILTPSRSASTCARCRARTATTCVQAHLDAALRDLASQVEVEVVMNDPASISRTDTPLWTCSSGRWRGRSPRPG